MFGSQGRQRGYKRGAHYDFIHAKREMDENNFVLKCIYPVVIKRPRQTFYPAEEAKQTVFVGGLILTRAT